MSCSPPRAAGLRSTITAICLAGLLAGLLLTAITIALERKLPSRTLLTCTPLSCAADWTGNWEFSPLGADPSEDGSLHGIDRVTIPFVITESGPAGAEFALQVRRGHYRAQFYVTVDGRPANRLPQDERGAYLVLTSPDYEPQVVTIPVADGLGEGPHVALVVADRGWDQWPLAGWSVRLPSDAAPYRRALVAWGVVGALSLAGLAYSRTGFLARHSGPGFPARHSSPGFPARHSSLGFLTHPMRASSLLSRLSRLLTRGIGIEHFTRFADHPAVVALILLAAGGFYFSPWLPLTLACGLVLAVLIILRLDLGLALVAATAPLYLHPRPLFGKAFSIAEVLTLLCLISWAVRAKKWLPATPGFRLDEAVVFFVLVSLTSALVAEHRRVALRELRVVVLEPALFYLMLRTTRLRDGEMKQVVDFFVGGAVAVALIGLVQYFSGVNLITAEEGLRRLRSVYGSPNNAALYLGRALPIAAAVAAFGASRGRRLAYGLSLFPLAAAVLLTFSKGALILGLPLSFWALLVLGEGKWRRLSLVAVAMAVVILALMFLLRVPRFLSLLDTTGGTTFFRLSLWRSSLTMLREHPWLGVGPDNFLYHYRSRYILPAAWQEPDLSHPHNLVLDYGCRLGLWGLAAALMLQAAFWRLAFPLRHLRCREWRALAIGAMGSMVNFLAHGLVDTSYFVIDLAFAFFLTLAVVQWLAEGKRDGTEEQFKHIEHGAPGPDTDSSGHAAGRRHERCQQVQAIHGIPQGARRNDPGN